MGHGVRSTNWPFSKRLAGYLNRNSNITVPESLPHERLDAALGSGSYKVCVLGKNSRSPASRRSSSYAVRIACEAKRGFCARKQALFPVTAQAYLLEFRFQRRPVFAVLAALLSFFSSQRRSQPEPRVAEPPPPSRVPVGQLPRPPVPRGCEAPA